MKFTSAVEAKCGGNSNIFLENVPLFLLFVQKYSDKFIRTSFHFDKPSPRINVFDENIVSKRYLQICL